MNEPHSTQIIPLNTNKLYREIGEEFHQILDFWKRFSPDNEYGGFAGKMDRHNRYAANAPKGSVLHCRILWTFAAAYSITGDPGDLGMATSAFEYIQAHFLDPLYGGLFWSVETKGNPLETHKQIYAQSFGIYGLSEYYRASGNAKALNMAIAVYRLVERYSHDPLYRGYIDAFTRDWSNLEDKRLSLKDDNAAKTMNTHLHVIEAYANLYTVWPDPMLLVNIRELLTIFEEKILDKGSKHLHLFFDEKWNQKPGPISYGHEMEAGWLLQCCATATGDELWMHLTRANALRITDAAMEGIDADGGLWYEMDNEKNQLIKEKHWWPQAEALVGLCNAWELSGDLPYRNALLRNWQFIKKYIIDHEKGEWYWGVDQHHKIMEGQDKMGMWKCPYHNARACIQLLKRLKSISGSFPGSSADTI